MEVEYVESRKSVSRVQSGDRSRCAAGSHRQQLVPHRRDEAVFPEVPHKDPSRYRKEGAMSPARCNWCGRPVEDEASVSVDHLRLCKEPCERHYRTYCRWIKTEAEARMRREAAT